jgi:hypothetical protein
MSHQTSSPAQEGEIILYAAPDGKVSIQLRAEKGTVWSTQAEMAVLFQTTPQNMTIHIKAIYEEGELQAEATCKESLQVRDEGLRRVTRSLKLYNLEMILAVGYRVKSERGTHFRKWATTHLKEYLIKGFVMNDERLKNPGGWDYFDELLARVREIRASEKRFYQKIRDIYATAVDYDNKSNSAQLFFKKAQNKMLWAITGKTAPEIIASRADSTLPNMGLQAWQGSRIRKQDVTIAKNYLNQKEIEELDRVVVMYLDYAEDQAKRRKTLSMRDWEEKLDSFLLFNDREVLLHAGKLSAEIAEKLAVDHYENFDQSRKESEKQLADQEDLKELEALEGVRKK